MPRNTDIDKAARHWAKEHNITPSQAYKSKHFREVWDFYLDHPTSSTARNMLGIKKSNKRKAGVKQSHSFRKEIRRYAIGEKAA